MIKPETEIIKVFATVVRQYPELLRWLEDWYKRELEMLPHVVNQPAVSQGRCQVLGELCRFVKESPSLATKL